MFTKPLQNNAETLYVGRYYRNFQINLRIFKTVKKCRDNFINVIIYNNAV